LLNRCGFLLFHLFRNTTASASFLGEDITGLIPAPRLRYYRSLIPISFTRSPNQTKGDKKYYIGRYKRVEKITMKKNTVRVLSFFFAVQVVLCVVPSPALAQYRTQTLDDRILINLQNNRSPAQTGFFMFLSKNLIYGDAGIPAGLMIGGIIGNNKAMRQNAVYVAGSTLVSAGFTQLIKILVKHPRPFVQNISITPVYRPGGYSFPSGHTSSSFATATALSLAYPKWYVIAPAYLWAGATGYSRMYLGVHNPSDVAAGAVLGAGSALPLLFLKK
jgi:membrane-associated phospholipid phosphatase